MEKFIKESDYLSVQPRDNQIQQEPFKSQTAFPATPGVDQNLVASMPQINPQTGLTHTENALLSNEEKAIKLRQQGRA